MTSWVMEEKLIDSIQVEQTHHEMPPEDGISIAHFLTVADVGRSARCYEKVFGARILTLGDGEAPGWSGCRPSMTTG